MKEIVKKVKLVEPVDPDTVNVMRDHYFTSAFIIDLPLDSAPDHVWQDFFSQEWKSSRHLWDRKLFVVGNKLRLITSPFELGDKLDWVKHVIARTNETVDEYNQEAEGRLAQIEEKKREAPEDEMNVELVRTILKKKFGTF